MEHKFPLNNQAENKSNDVKIINTSIASLLEHKSIAYSFAYQPKL